MKLISKYLRLILLAIAFKSTAAELPLPSRYSEELQQARNQLNILLQKYTDRHPEVLRTRKNIKQLEAETRLSSKIESAEPPPLTLPSTITKKELTLKPLPATVPAGQRAVDIKIDPAQTFQTMQGFGSTVRLFDDPHLSKTWDPLTKRASVSLTRSQEDEILKLVYEDLGLSRVRPATSAGIEVTNDNSNPNKTDLRKFDFSWKKNDAYIDFIRRVTPLGVQTFFLSPIKLESWMNGTNPDEYVEWAFSILQRWRNQGVELPYYSIVNEPSYNRSGIWSKEYLHEVVILLGRKLKEHGFKTKLVIPDDLNPVEAYKHSSFILADPEARQYIGALAYHLYGGRNAKDLAKLSASYHIPLWMTEFSQFDNVLEWASLMHQQITEYNVAAIDYMWSFFGSWTGNSLISLKFQNNSYKGLEIKPNYYAIKHYSRYIRPGFKRVSASSANSGLNVSAYVKSDDMVVVILNRSNQVISGHLTLANNDNLPRLDAVNSWNGNYWKASHPSVKNTQELEISLPPASITTLYTP